jgi:hypothetical protein
MLGKAREEVMSGWNVCKNGVLGEGEKGIYAFEINFNLPPYTLNRTHSKRPHLADSCVIY